MASQCALRKVFQDIERTRLGAERAARRSLEVLLECLLGCSCHATMVAVPSWQHNAAQASSEHTHADDPEDLLHWQNEDLAASRRPGTNEGTSMNAVSITARPRRSWLVHGV